MGYNPEKYFSSIENKNQYRKIAKIREVTLNLDKSAVISISVQGKDCNALVDTGATRCCISKKYYDNLNLPGPKELYGLIITTASGESIAPVGMVECPFTIGKRNVSHNFIICEKIRRPIILGLDFLRNIE